MTALVMCGLLVVERFDLTITMAQLRIICISKGD